jgi:hypothetical protein
MTDEEFVRAFLDRSLSPAGFHHRDHVRLTWLLIRQVGEERAAVAVAEGIRRFAAAHGQPEKYHETLTQFWVRLIAHLYHARPELTTFAAFIDTFPWVLEKELPYRHWRRETLGSRTARVAWVEPDLLGLPQSA